jgi:hypothetical protein
MGKDTKRKGNHFDEFKMQFMIRAAPNVENAQARSACVTIGTLAANQVEKHFELLLLTRGPPRTSHPFTFSLFFAIAGARLLWQQ